MFPFWYYTQDKKLYEVCQQYHRMMAIRVFLGGCYSTWKSHLVNDFNNIYHRAVFPVRVFELGPVQQNFKKYGEFLHRNTDFKAENERNWLEKASFSKISQNLIPQVLGQ